MVRKFYNKRVNKVSKFLYSRKLSSVLYIVAVAFLMLSVCAFLFRDSLMNFEVLARYRYLTEIVFYGGEVFVGLSGILFFCFWVLEKWKVQFYRNLSLVVEELSQLGVLDVRSLGLTFTRREAKGLFNKGLNNYDSEFMDDLHVVLPKGLYQEVVVAWQSVLKVDMMALKDCLGMEIDSSSNENLSYFESLLYSWSGAKVLEIKR